MKQKLWQVIGVTFCIFAMAVVCQADLENVNLHNQLINIIKQIKNTSTRAAVSLGSLIQEGSDLVTSNPTKYETADKAKLTAYKTLVNDAKDSLDLVVNYDWGYME